MNLRLIVLTLALLSFLSTTTGGYFYYSALQESAIEKSHKEAGELTQKIADYIDSNLAEHQKTVRALSELEEIRNAFVKKDEGNLAEANSILDRFRDAFMVNVCYLMDDSGNTVASSNRGSPSSFVGINYAFRPYFRRSIQGSPSIYMALGVTSKKRGVYYSHPVYDQDRDAPIGIAVIKASVDNINKYIEQAYDGIMLLTDSQGIVFASNRTDWLYHSLRQLSPEEITGIKESRQFGSGPWDWTGMDMENLSYALNSSGNKYYLHESSLNNYPGWDIIYMHDRNIVLKSTTAPLFKSVGYTVLSLSFITGLFVFILYRMAHEDIIRRRRAEERIKNVSGEREILITELKKRTADLASINNELESEIAERYRAEKELKSSEEYFRSLIENAMDTIAVLDNDGTIAYTSPSLERVLGYGPEELVGTHVLEFVHPEDKTKASEALKRTATITDHSESLEVMYCHKNGSWKTLEVIGRNFIDDAGTTKIIINSRDITERKNAEEEREKLIVELKKAFTKVKTLSGLLPICSACKKIRNDKGYWEQVEVYIHEHSDAEISHGMCPDCAKILYPKYFTKPD